jgi:NitT/TauT family transport system substrate-binding protein
VGHLRAATAYHEEAFGKRDNCKLVPGANYREMIGILSTALKQPPELVASGLPCIDPEGRLDVGDIEASAVPAGPGPGRARC